MALNAIALETELLTLFASPPWVEIDGQLDAAQTRSACAAAWADAMSAFVSTILPLSSSVAAAALTLRGSLETAFATHSAMSAVDGAFQAFGATLALGMTPAFIGAPPPLAPGFEAAALEPFPSTHEQAAARWRARLEAWIRTGTATPAAGGAPVPWS